MAHNTIYMCIYTYWADVNEARTDTHIHTGTCMHLERSTQTVQHEASKRIIASVFRSQHNKIAQVDDRGRISKRVYVCLSVLCSIR